MDILVGLVVILVGAVALASIARPQPAGVLDAFGAGFLPYRGPGWPRGVQEEDPVPWSWSAAGEGGTGSGGSAEGPDMVDVSGMDVPAATDIDPGPLGRGNATRRT